MNKSIYCEACGCEIYDTSRCSMYRSAGPYYETVYICEDCADSNKNDIEEAEFKHVDMDNGVRL